LIYLDINIIKINPPTISTMKKCSLNVIFKTFIEFIM